MSRGNGKLISKHAITVDGVAVELPVRMRADEYGSHTFNIILDEHDLNVWTGEGGDEDETLDDLIRRATDKLEARFAIAWVPMIQVAVNLESGVGTQHGYGWDGGRSSGFSWRYLDVGERADGGKAWKRSKMKVIENGELLDGRQDATFTGNRYPANFAVIADTSENREALESIASAFDALQTKLAAFLDRDQILKTLANVSLLGLPAPKT